MSAFQQIEMLASTWLMYSHVCVSTDRSLSFYMAGATESGWGVQSPCCAAQQACHRLLHLPDPGDCDGLPK